jgi:hypothetical protein
MKNVGQLFVESTGTGISIFHDGFKIAKRGRPGAPQARNLGFA